MSNNQSKTRHNNPQILSSPAIAYKSPKKLYAFTFCSITFQNCVLFSTTSPRQLAPGKSIRRLLLSRKQHTVFVACGSFLARWWWWVAIASCDQLILARLQHRTCSGRFGWKTVSSCVLVGAVWSCETILVLTVVVIYYLKKYVTCIFNQLPMIKLK